MNFIKSATWATDLTDNRGKKFFNENVNLDLCESYMPTFTGDPKNPTTISIVFKMVSGRDIEWRFKTREERNTVHERVDNYIAKYNTKTL